ncbi:hypothetical protein C0J52_16435 [Blattella germanica]|nr:hypothetical protein C0J52_16435 [Blattella germanica]
MADIFMWISLKRINLTTHTTTDYESWRTSSKSDSSHCSIAQQVSHMKTQFSASSSSFEFWQGPGKMSNELSTETKIIGILLTTDVTFPVIVMFLFGGGGKGSHKGGCTWYCSCSFLLKERGRVGVVYERILTLSTCSPPNMTPRNDILTGMTWSKKVPLTTLPEAEEAEVQELTSKSYKQIPLVIISSIGPFHPMRRYDSPAARRQDNTRVDPYAVALIHFYLRKHADFLSHKSLVSVMNSLSIIMGGGNRTRDIKSGDEMRRSILEAWRDPKMVEELANVLKDSLLSELRAALEKNTKVIERLEVALKRKDEKIVHGPHGPVNPISQKLSFAPNARILSGGTLRNNIKEINVMPKYKGNKSVLIEQWIKDVPGLTYDGTIIFCCYCCKEVSQEKKSHINQHDNSLIFHATMERKR